MGCQERDLSEETSVSSSLSDALLFTTMCIIGLPVEVQVKDGSIYSGIFHTACAEKDYGIVLKKARMTKKGKRDVNLANGSVIDTLVVLSGDLVQVIAKGVMLPADGIVGNVTGEDVPAVNGSNRPPERPQNELKMMKSSKAAPTKRKQISQTRSYNQNKNKNGYGSRHIDVDEGQIMRAVAAKSVESAVEVVNGKADGVHSTRVEEASTVPVITVDEGQAGEDKLQGKNNGFSQKFEARKDETIHGQCSTSTNASTIHCYTLQDASLPQLESVNGGHVEISAKMSLDRKPSGSHVPSYGNPDIHDCERPTVTDFSSSDAPEISTSSTTVVDISQSCSNPLASPTVSVASKVSNTNSKDFKLNPGAKTFSPIFAIPRSAAPPAAATVPSMAYVPNSATVVPVAGAQPETGINPFAPQSSLPIKFVHYNNLVAVNDVSGSQYHPQPIVGHVGSRPQPVRYASHYAPFQAAPTYVHPNSQSVMVSRLGQLVYVHPVSHDVIQSATTPAAHPLFAPSLAHLPKQQGIAAAQGLPIRVTPPSFIASSGQQPFTVPVHIPLSQPPFQSVRPIQVPGANSHFVNGAI
ncbi:Ataxin 2 [Macleaya cordata]|uniref:Ataxin 2 n=1 Tax=Macleaya cordata TaxID=56857 RepID=A0A200QJD0_MACCD|nr:Ataxin 2 [Macleaya cordata]